MGSNPTPAALQRFDLTLSSNCCMIVCMSELSDAILLLRSEGKSYNEIHRVTGASKGTISYHCGAGQKEHARNRTKDKRSKIRAYIQEAKQAAVCDDCGEDYPYWILEFDHVRGVKLFNIAMFRQFTSKLEDVKAEIAKCDIVCSNCHKNRTYLRLLRTGDSTTDLEGIYYQT